MDGEIAERIVASLERINVRLDGIDKRLDGMDKRFDKVDARLDRVDMRLNLVEGQAAERHAELVGKMNRVDAKVDRLHDDMKHRINAVEVTAAQWGTSVAIQNGRDLRFDARLALIAKRREIRDNPGA